MSAAPCLGANDGDGRLSHANLQKAITAASPPVPVSWSQAGYPSARMACRQGSEDSEAAGGTPVRTCNDGLTHLTPLQPTAEDLHFSAASSAAARGCTQSTPLDLPRKAFVVASEDAVNQDDFKSYSKALANKLSKGKSSVSQSICNFMQKVEQHLSSDGSVDSSFSPFNLQLPRPNVDPERVVVEISVQKKSDHFHVRYASWLHQPDRIAMGLHADDEQAKNGRHSLGKAHGDDCLTEDTHKGTFLPLPAATKRINSMPCGAPLEHKSPASGRNSTFDEKMPSPARCAVQKSCSAIPLLSTTGIGLASPTCVSRSPSCARPQDFAQLGRARWASQSEATANGGSEQVADAACWARLHEQLESLHQCVQDYSTRHSLKTEGDESDGPDDDRLEHCTSLQSVDRKMQEHATRYGANVWADDPIEHHVHRTEKSDSRHLVPDEHALGAMSGTPQEIFEVDRGQDDLSKLQSLFVNSRQNSRATVATSTVFTSEIPNLDDDVRPWMRFRVAENTCHHNGTVGGTDKFDLHTHTDQPLINAEPMGHTGNIRSLRIPTLSAPQDSTGNPEAIGASQASYADVKTSICTKALHADGQPPICTSVNSVKLSLGDLDQRAMSPQKSPTQHFFIGTPLPYSSGLVPTSLSSSSLSPQQQAGTVLKMSLLPQPSQLSCVPRATIRTAAPTLVRAGNLSPMPPCAPSVLVAGGPRPVAVAQIDATGAHSKRPNLMTHFSSSR